jgi:hypothetical protein
MKLKEIMTLNEIGEISSVSKYLPKESFDNFQNKLSELMSQLKAEIKKKVGGREVSFRGAKGFGQIEQTHTALISDVDLVLYQDRYTILFKGSEGKSKKQNEYYIDPTSNVYMKIGVGAAPTSDVQIEPKVKPKPVVQPTVPKQNVSVPKKSISPVTKSSQNFQR